MLKSLQLLFHKKKKIKENDHFCIIHNFMKLCYRQYRNLKKQKKI